MDLQQFRHTIEKYPPELKYLMHISTSLPGEEQFTKPPQNFNWDRFIRIMQQHQLTSMIFPYLSKHKNHIPANAYGRIRSIQQRNTRKALAHVEQTINLQSLFDKEGIPVLFFKGVVLSQMLYGDPLLKNSIDIDILVPPRHIGQTAELMQRRGYRMTYPDIRLSQRQEKINYRISHHYEFQHPKKRIKVELHWKLINPQILLPLSFDFLYGRSVTAELQGHPVNTLSIKDYMVYLSVHGAKHRWYSLTWLKDLSRLLEQSSQQLKTEALKQSKQLGLERCFLQGCLLNEIIYGPGTGLPLMDKKDRLMQMVRLALRSIPQTREEIRSQKLRGLRYRFWLRRNIKYKLTLLFRLRTHHSDWSRLPLPDCLFFLYYPMRPVLWLVYKVKKRL
jgi:hypothetical protein